MNPKVFSKKNDLPVKESDILTGIFNCSGVSMTGMIPIWHWLKISNDPQPWMVSYPKRVHKMVYSHPLRETYQVSLFFLFFLFLFLGIATNHPDYPHYIPTLLLVYLSVFFYGS